MENHKIPASKEQIDIANAEKLKRKIIKLKKLQL
jgi:hypothetical protein